MKNKILLGAVLLASAFILSCSKANNATEPIVSEQQDTVAVADTVAVVDSTVIRAKIADGKELLQNFYANYVFGNKSFTKVAKTMCSTQLLKYLKDNYDYDCDDGSCYALWLFRTNSQDGPSNVSKVKDVTYIEDGWYEVSYLDMGMKGRTSLQLEEVDGKMQIVNMRQDASFGKKDAVL